jgi:hypothetical protein
MMLDAHNGIIALATKAHAKTGVPAEACGNACKNAKAVQKGISFFLCASILFFSMTVPACGKRHVHIDRNTRIAIDTLVSQEINELRPMLDSVCALKMDSLVASMRDSVFEARQEEMRKLIGK